MRKHKMLLLSLSIALCLTACGGISQAKYEKLLSEKETLQNEMDSLKNEKDALDDNYDKLQSNYNELQSDYDELEKETTDTLTDFTSNYYDNLKTDTLISVWAKDSFGSNVITGSLGNDQRVYQVIVTSSYSPSDWNTIVDEFGKSGTSLNSLYLSADTEEKKGFTKCEKVYVKYLDPTGQNIVEFSMRKNGIVFEAGDININMKYTSEIIAAAQGGN